MVKKLYVNSYIIVNTPPLSDLIFSIEYENHSYVRKSQ